jgi:NAD(P)-dependent dehydrogenase (short-subunit alcohol dehydrogenase family)
MSRYLVTGGSRGIGAALVARLAGRGDEVVVVSRTAPAQGAWIKCDLARPEGFASVAARAGRLDGLIHCAGIWEAAAFSPDYAFADCPPQETLAIIAVNLTAPILLTQALLPNLNAGARIVLIGSTSGLDRIGSPEVAYNASKAGLRGAAQALHRALAPRHPVTLINPGDVATEGTSGLLIPLADVVLAVELALALSGESYLPELTIDTVG